MKPQAGESRQDFMDRCVPEMIDDNPDWDRSEAQDACAALWRNRDNKDAKRSLPAVVHKVHASAPDGLDFVLSDETPDRMGDVISIDGWDLRNFKKNPIALFNHRAGEPIGIWKNVHVEDGELIGTLALAPEGTSPRIDEIRRLVEAKILRAVSVGFAPEETAPINPTDPFGGVRFIKQELVETSLVAVPANPNALAIAKSLNVSPETIALVFAKSGRSDERDPPGKSAERQLTHGKTKAMTFGQRIQEAEQRLNTRRDALRAHVDALDNENVSDADMARTQQLNSDVAQARKVHQTLLDSEIALGDGIRKTETTESLEIRLPARDVRNPATARPFATAGKKREDGDYVWKALVTLTKINADRYRKATALEVLRDTCGEDEKALAVFHAITGKAATVPALTTQVGWAAELVHTEVGAFIASLAPVSVFPKLAARGSSFTFGRNGIISLPMRSATPTIAGSFVGEGQPIPVRQGAFQALQLTPKKMAVISVFSREIAEHSDPAIEGILRDAIVEDTGVAIDSVLLDANPATLVRPAGLRNGVVSLTPTAGGGFAALVGDIKQLGAALLTPTLGNIREPVWLMSPTLALSIALTATVNGDLPFRDEISRGTFMGWPAIVSASVTADTLYLLDAADFASVTSTEPKFDISDTATVHMEDTSPLPISATGAPNVVAAPVRSFWQTDTIGIRMLMPMNWALRRPGMVAYVTGVTWK